MSAYSVSRVRRSLINFSIGKGLGMVLGIGSLLTLVRALEIEAYSFYIISQALLAITDSLSSLGLGAIAYRYLPELYSRSEGRMLSKLTGLLCILRVVSLLFSVLLLYFVAEYLVEVLSISGMAPSMRLFLVVVFFELFARYLDTIFNSLLMQGTSQISMLLRSSIRVFSVLWLLLSGGEAVTLTTWIIIDAAAAVVGCVWGGAMLWRFMQKTTLEIPGTDQSLDFRRYYRYSLPFYLADTITNLSNQNLIKLIATKVLNSSQFASFGFAASFIQMLRRYLPMFLLINMIRPLFISARQKPDYKMRIPMLAGLVFKLNMFMLVPLVVILGVYNNEIANILTGGRYPEVGSYIIAFLPILITQTIHNVTSLISQAMENSSAPFVATILSLFGILFGVLMSKTIGVYGLCLGLVMSDIIFSVWVLKAVVFNKLIYNYDVYGYLKLIALTLITFSMLYVISDTTRDISIIYLIIYGLIVVSTYLLFAWILKPFSQVERDIINKILKRNVFVW